jgi:hypothetical protein
VSDSGVLKEVQWELLPSVTWLSEIGTTFLGVLR